MIDTNGEIMSCYRSFGVLGLGRGAHPGDVTRGKAVGMEDMDHQRRGSRLHRVENKREI